MIKASYSYQESVSIVSSLGPVTRVEVRKFWNKIQTYWGDETPEDVLEGLKKIAEEGKYSLSSLEKYYDLHDYVQNMQKEAVCLFMDTIKYGQDRPCVDWRFWYQLVPKRTAVLGFLTEKSVCFFKPWFKTEEMKSQFKEKLGEALFQVGVLEINLDLLLERGYLEF